MHVHARVIALAGVVAAIAAGPSGVSAQGLHLKLKTETSQVAASQAVKLTLEAVALRSLSLPAAPVFLVEDGGEARPSEPNAGHGGRVEITPDKPHKGTYELTLAKPGTYKIQAEYRVDERRVRSNKVTVTVTQ